MHCWPALAIVVRARGAVCFLSVGIKAPLHLHWLKLDCSRSSWEECGLMAHTPMRSKLVVYFLLRRNLLRIYIHVLTQRAKSYSSALMYYSSSSRSRSKFSLLISLVCVLAHKIWIPEFDGTHKIPEFEEFAALISLLPSI